MNRYIELREKHQNRVNNLPIGFAIDENDFREMMEKWGLDPEKDLDKICQISKIAFAQKKDMNLITETMLKNWEEMKEARKNRDFLYDMFVAEMHNHEYSLTWDLKEVLDDLNITMEDIVTNPIMREELIKADMHIREETYWPSFPDEMSIESEA